MTDAPLPAHAQTLTYSSYLRLPEMLELQNVRSDPEEHDELLFIVIHQAYELWFKLMLHELDKVMRDFHSNDLYGAIATFKRLRTIMKTLVEQLDVLETMTPMSFSSFRDRLETSSGFQSSQFREFEFVLGFKREHVLQYYPEGSAGLDNVMRRLNEPTVVDGLYAFLKSNGASIPENLFHRTVTEPNAANEDVQDAIFALYKQRPDLTILFELMTDFDEGIQEWRYRHVKIVERTIGAKQGTGGSLGVEFLKRSLFTPVFADLWAIRHRM